MAQNPSNPERAVVSRRNFLYTSSVAGIIGVAGCLGSNENGGGGDDNGGENGGTGGDGNGGDGPGEPSGTINASGSNTVAPITDWAGENFMNEYPDAVVDVNPQGTGAGFAEFVQGNSDVQSASREILDDEAADAEANGVEYSHYEVGWDGLAVVKNAENDWLEEITLDELRAVWEFESDVLLWSDIRDEYPDEEIHLHARDSASGTFDYFTLHINGQLGNIRDDYSATSQTNEIMAAVAGNEHALGWGGVGYYHAIADDQPIETVAVESDEESGEFYHPTEANIESGAYTPLTRPLFIYVNHYGLEQQPNLLGSFVRFYFNGQEDFARDEGFYATAPEIGPQNHEEFTQVLEALGIDGSVYVQPDV